MLQRERSFAGRLTPALLSRFLDEWRQTGVADLGSFVSSFKKTVLIHNSMNHYFMGQLSSLDISPMK